ncbi:MAG TPA: hypothetical protein VGO61_13485 [Steroidobacteraceae bacterium]|jgi:hypothetical protein|nr:hypothetical protein [Steroidobacteraceae bacterium]
MKRLIAASCLLLSSTLAFAGPDFSGTYKLDPATKFPTNRPIRSPLGTVKIEQKGGALTLTLISSVQDANFGGIECSAPGKCQVYGFSHKPQENTAVVIEGNVISVNSTIPGARSPIERFELSADGKQLLVTYGHEMPPKSVYNRQ